MLSLTSVIGILFVVRRSVSGVEYGGYDLSVVVHSDSDISDDEGSLTAASLCGGDDLFSDSVGTWPSARPPSPPLRKPVDPVLPIPLRDLPTSSTE